MVSKLDHRIGATLLRRPVVIFAKWMRQCIDRGLEHRAGAELEPAIDSVHVAALVDEELPSLVSLLNLEVETRRVDRVPGAGGENAQVLDREAARVLHPGFLIDRAVDPAAGLLHPLLQVTYDRSSLEADLTGPERLGDTRHLLELSTDAQSVRSRAPRHLALLGHPRDGAVAFELVVAAKLDRRDDSAEFRLKPVDERRELALIDQVVVFFLQLSNRLPKLVHVANIVRTKVRQHN